MKIIDVRREGQRIHSLKFLEECRALNIYLYEGVERGLRRHKCYHFTNRGRSVGLLHTKNRFHHHLFLSEGIDEEAVKEVVSFTFRVFPESGSVFGDAPGVERFIKAAGVKTLKKTDFMFMEVTPLRLIPFRQYSACRAEPWMAEKLLPLQIQYEIEELGAPEDEIDRSMTLIVLKKRIERGEVTAIFEGAQAAAIAGVNARFLKTCQIGSVYVQPSLRRKGYGCSVVSAHVQRMLERYDKVVLFVGRENIPALRLYEKLGFQERGSLIYVRFFR